MSQAPRTSGFRVLVASSLTKLHPGAGRSPGVVDLPVIRDPLGYPYVPGSQVKGALKSLLARKLKCMGDKGRASCGGDTCSCLCCLLGAETGGEGASALQVTDLYPLLLPAPSAEVGVVYVTSPTLLSYAASILEAAGRGEEAGALRTAAKLTEEGKAAASFEPPNGSVYLGLERIEAEDNRSELKSALEKLTALYKGLHPLYETLDPLDRSLVVPEEDAVSIVESLLHRVTRVRLDRLTKTVGEGFLWTEEYLPWGTLLVGGIAETGFHSSHCEACGLLKGRSSIDVFVELLKKAGVYNGKVAYIVIGGKESVGGGLVKLAIR